MDLCLLDLWTLRMRFANRGEFSGGHYPGIKWDHRRRGGRDSYLSVSEPDGVRLLGN